ncbi:MAG TPA: hypothetical protein VHI13_08000 [Candidatus Kapabacteria bacterium]|nr:hypothetical protein [Candidatus Kapabacteria bacterium]
MDDQDYNLHPADRADEGGAAGTPEQHEGPKQHEGPEQHEGASQSDERTSADPQAAEAARDELRRKLQQERALLNELRLKRLQRTAEYALLISMHLFFLLAFHSFYRWWMALLLAAATFGMNFRLTQFREERRTSAPGNRKRIMADAFESILFLVFIAVLSAGGLLQHLLDVTDQEYLAYVSALLTGVFLAGLVGEIYWQAKHFSPLDRERRRNYIANLKRTIVLPYTISRRRHNGHGA